MKTQEADIAERITRVQTAVDEGALACHHLIQSMNASDTKTASSWGPAMRR